MVLFSVKDGFQLDGDLILLNTVISYFVGFMSDDEDLLPFFSDVVFFLSVLQRAMSSA